MTRWVSLVVLTVFVVLFSVLFFWVMARFTLPLFMAVLLAVIFRPLHVWFVKKCRNRDRIAAVLTTVAILVIVLVPLIVVLFRAATDAYGMFKASEMEINAQAVSRLVIEVNDRFGLDLNPEEIQQTVVDGLSQMFEPLALRTPAFVVQLLIGFIVMIVALYYFLADGDDMVETVMRFIPLDNRYQQQLLSEFEKVSRAVVSATLLSALAQGLLAGIAFKLAGLDSVFLLIMLTMLLAMVPFVGALAVWGPCVLYLFFVEQRTTAAILLGIYGAGIISTIDNVIKPIVLHGQSKLHPLLALLSVLGGVQALGPIGIFVGPMAVAFLQAGLNMLHGELRSFDNDGEPPASIPG